MKKILGIIIKSLLGLILLILILLFTIPIVFKEKIKAKVETVINESVNAKVTFSNYKLTFFRNFPNLSFSLKDMYIAGIDKFEGDTLAGFKSFDLIFNLGSILSKSGYEVNSIIIDQAVVNAIVLKDGKANWDIMKPSASDSITVVTEKTGITKDTVIVPSKTGTSSSGSSMKILLRKFEIRQSSISYSDSSSKMNASLKDFNFTLKGYMTLSTTGLKLDLKIAETSFSMDGVRYLNKASIGASIDLLADLDKMKFTLQKNFFGINDLRLNFAGTVEMPKDDIITDLTFGTEKTSFKTLLSLVPAVYMSDYKDLSASGDFALSGSAKGIYSDADSTLPDIVLNLSVNDGLISYPALPEKISKIAINANVFVNGKDLDKTTVNLDKFHMELAGSPFDLTFFLKTPMSDPDFKGSLNGKIDLAALTKAVPLDSIKLTGIFDMAISLAGKMSMIEKEQYDKFEAQGTLGVKNILVNMAGYPEVKVNEALFQFTPAYADLRKAEIVVEKSSDFSLSGKFENYLQYVFRNETLKGQLTLHSNNLDASAIMATMASDTTTATTDTTSLSVIPVPRNVDFNFNALIEKFSYDSIRAESITGHISVGSGILSLKQLAMKILGGTILVTADYDTRDTLKPVMNADLNIQDIEVKDAFKTFQIVQKFAPSAKGIDGKISVQLVFKSLLGADMMPIMQSIDGSGKLHSNQIQLVESPVFDKIKGVLKLGDKYSNTFNNIDISFKIKEGRVYVTPFDAKLGNIKMNIGGDQGLDQTLNYLVKTEIPRTDLGNSVNALIDNLSSQAASYGVAIKPSDVLKINVRVSGTFKNPLVVPVFGSTADGGTVSKKEAAKETVKQLIDDNADKAKEKLRPEAEAQGDKLIKEAEERGQQIHDEAVKAADKVKQEAAVQGQDLIKAAESKGFLAKAAAQKSADVLNKEAAKKADKLILEADNQAKKLVDEAKMKKEDLIKKL